jgi:hypothetical protein
MGDAAQNVHAQWAYGYGCDPTMTAMHVDMSVQL